MSRRHGMSNTLDKALISVLIIFLSLVSVIDAALFWLARLAGLVQIRVRPVANISFACCPLVFNNSTLPVSFQVALVNELPDEDGDLPDVRVNREQNARAQGRSFAAGFEGRSQNQAREAKHGQ